MERLRGWVIAALAVGVVMLPGVAQAADIIVPLDTVISSGVAEGEKFELALIASNDLDGETCAVRTVHTEDGAVHPGNHLVVTSGANSTRLDDVEREAGAVTDGASTLTLADVIMIELEMGPDQHYGGDLELEFECGDQVTALRSAPQQTGDDDGDDGGVLPFTGGQITVTLAIAAGLIGVALALMLVARRHPSPPGPTSAT